MSTFQHNAPEDFRNPTELPRDLEQSRRWQEANRSWWESNPMRYDWKIKINYPEFSKEYYQEIDRRFFSDVQQYMPYRIISFDPLIDFSSLKNKAVLEIGVGGGSHAQLLAQNSGSFIGIDLTDWAVKCTSSRMQCFGINATIKKMDAESLEFADNTFDLVWSWGVIHHSSNTGAILKEIQRVLKPGGEAIIMVYHRNFWNYYILAGFFHGILRGELFITKSLHKTMQRNTDGAIARYYSISQWKKLVIELFEVSAINIFGSKVELVPLPAGKIKQFVLSLIPNGIGRFFTNRCQMGGFLVSKLRKRI